MKKPFFFLYALLMGCNCGAPTSTMNEAPISVEVLAPTEGNRAKNKKLMDHIADRTVHVDFDCTVKEGALVIGTTKPNTYLDGRGSGTIVLSKDKKSYIYTAAHVVEIDKKYKDGYDCEVSIILNKNHGDLDKKIHARILVENTGTDVAVLEVDINLNTNTELEINPFQGDNIWAAGYPADFLNSSYREISITKGTIASVRVPTKSGNYHRVTSQVYYGSSGGGIWSEEGKLIGIVSALITDAIGSPYEGYYYVKPVEEVTILLRAKQKYNYMFGQEEISW